MNIAVCDDQRDVLDHMAKLVKSVPFVASAAAFNDIAELFSSIGRGDAYDAILMDCEWKQKDNGLHFAASLSELSPKSTIIFVTAYPLVFSQQIFLSNTRLGGFLIKPVDFDLLAGMLSKIKNEALDAESKKLVVSVSGIATSFEPSEIYYIESRARKSVVHTKDGETGAYHRLSDLQKQLPDYFVFSHKSYLVNMNHIRALKPSKISLVTGAEIPLSRARSAQFRDTYFRHIGGV